MPGWRKAPAPPRKHAGLAESTVPEESRHYVRCPAFREDPLPNPLGTQGHEPVYIHPADAASRGIAEGDVVRVLNDRGQILAGARLSDDVRPGVIAISEGG